MVRCTKYYRVGEKIENFKNEISELIGSDAFEFLFHSRTIHPVKANPKSRIIFHSSFKLLVLILSLSHLIRRFGDL